LAIAFFSKRITIAEPIKPVPPVISIFIISQLLITIIVFKYKAKHIHKKYGIIIYQFLLCSLIKQKIMTKLIKTIEDKSANAMKVIFRLKKI
jgi:hypothetical protein